ncbi:hypothetical protein [Aeromonas dhakensis]|uniref:hypothetical protein n=1 Tax=Aeromonas dhakensis TaxID=196024 RepID=UPI001FCB4DC0|nr:hypothetical protein [Aeromonas dhakensis]MCJ2367342.1 hypothetical protein [Aeromonas dhakensis]
MMGQDCFRLPSRIHDIGSLVFQAKQWSQTPSVEDLWMAYLARIPMERTREEIHALQSWFYQEVEEQGYELLLI